MGVQIEDFRKTQRLIRFPESKRSLLKLNKLPETLFDIEGVNTKIIPKLYYAHP